MKRRNQIITIVFLLYIGFFAIGSIVLRDRTFSELENRQLAAFPEVSFSSIAKGAFMEDFETYMQDQIILKDELVTLHTTVTYGMNVRLINGVYFASEGRLIQDYSYDEAQLSENVSFVNDFAESYPDYHYTWLVAPTAGEIYGETLPDHAPYDSQKQALSYLQENVSDKITLIIPEQELLMHKSEYLYYRTDHHWTQNGAYYGYRALCEGLGIEPKEKDAYQVNEPSKSFYGTLYSKAPRVGVEPDSIFLYENPAGAYQVDYPEENETKDGLYQYENLMKKDKYTVYLGGNHPLMVIHGNGELKEPVLVIKDSYAHCLLPFLADHYAEIHVLDLRYYHKSVSEYAKEHGIENIILINNVDFLTTDNNFLWLY